MNEKQMAVLVVMNPALCFLYHVVTIKSGWHGG
jgi:hypothetical protein